VTPADHHRVRIIIPILLACAGYAFFNIGDSAIKMVAASMSVAQVFFLSSASVLFCAGVYGALIEGKKAFQTRKPKLMLVRAVLSQINSLLNIIALPHIPLTTFYTLIFTSPLWVALLSSHFLGDKLEKKRIGVIFFGFLVVVFVFRPDGGAFNIWSLLVLVSALIYSIQLILMRHIGPSESRPFMLGSSSLLSILLSAPFVMLDGFIMPTPYEWGLFAIMGVTGTIGLLCIIHAFQAAPSAALIAPYHYTQILWGALIGYFIFQEVPTISVVVGAFLITLSGLYLLYSERKKGARTEI